ncbi:apical endosomal glycoprotein [Alosa sapidissima]|uniref:apical endosomal glycoprotein n=1 Tax=Alosa sapidissima TaxID=34773 RepID=UPI001C088586|nr:apical endosomal glycoprotein [Alosa sapidissima]
MEFMKRTWLVLLLLGVKMTLGLERQQCEGSQKCDFVCDCSDCSDEHLCGYSGPEFVCDFEQPDMCGWAESSTQKLYTWERRQRGATLPASGPSCDYTTGTDSGWFMGVTSVNSDSNHTALLMSPKMQQSSATCRLIIRYFIWDSGHTGFEGAPLWASILGQDNQQAVVWRPESTSIRGWREASVFLGRTPTPFFIQLHSTRSQGRRGDVAVDQLEFRDCTLPNSGSVPGCPLGWFECRRGGCVEGHQVCDGTDDCGDESDEETCGGYWFCNFEKDLCEWDLRTLSPLRWSVSSQADISLSDPLRGPGRDHSNNTASGKFLYVTKPDNWTTLMADWSSFHSPLLEPTNSTHPCKMVMYTHQFGPRSGGLSVLVAGEKINPVWERGGSLGDLWVRAKVDFVVNSTFQILFVGAIRDREYGGIGVDSIMLSPGCRRSNDTAPKPVFPKPPPNPCTSKLELFCDFQPDCPGNEDEAQCGDFSYAQGSSGWTDTSIGSQGWMLTSDTGAKYLSVVAAPGQQLSEAQTRTPLLGPSGPSCSLSFSYRLTGKNPRIGDLFLSVVDSVLGPQPKLWEFSGRTSESAGDWQNHTVYIGARSHRFQLEFSARAKQLSDDSQIAVKDVLFVSCHADSITSTATGVSCNFEEDLCSWYQDQTDNYDWERLTGMDHTISVGSSMVVELWSPSLRGLSGRLLSFPQPTTTKSYCLSFYYKIYGPHTGGLNVKLLHADDAEELLWARSGAHGNRWHEGLCSVSSSLNSYQLVFEAQRLSFDGLVAIDDITIVPGLCSLPSLCSFEGQTCGYTSTSTGSPLWAHQRAGAGPNGPKTDHTMETENGFYMVANTGADALPRASVSTLTSSVRTASSNTECVHFWYHTGGEKPGSLSVYVKPKSGDRIKIFTNTINQGDMWRHANANISITQQKDYQLEFEAEGAGGERTHIAIDDVIFSAHSCHAKGTVCDLERGLCGWSNTQNPSQDQLDWEVTSASGESRLPTPYEDHTLKTEKGNFLFLPSTTRTPASSKAWLLGPHLPPTDISCLRFWLHRQGSSGKLRVLRLALGLEHELFVAPEGVSSDWIRHDLNITSAEEFQIVFEGTTGTEGVTALDDIEFKEGVSCSDVIKPPPTASPPSAAGGIAASIIVGLLLLGAFAAIMYFYLRVRERIKATTQSEISGGISNEVYESASVQGHGPASPSSSHVDVVGFGNKMYAETSEETP